MQSTSPKTRKKSVLFDAENPDLPQEQENHDPIIEEEVQPNDPRYTSLDFTHKTSTTIHNLIKSKNKPAITSILQTHFNLVINPSTPFDPLQMAPKAPDVLQWDTCVREGIFSDLLVNAMVYSVDFVGLDEFWMEVWGTVVKRVHVRFIDKVLNGVGDVGKVCLDEFRKIFFGLVQECNTLENQISFIQCKQLIDYFTITYIQHIKLITQTFTTPQSRFKQTINLPLLPIHEQTALSAGVLAENWEQFLMDEENARVKAIEDEKLNLIRMEEERLKKIEELQVQKALDEEQQKIYLYKREISSIFQPISIKPSSPTPQLGKEIFSGIPIVPSPISTPKSQTASSDDTTLSTSTPASTPAKPVKYTKPNIADVLSSTGLNEYFDNFITHFQHRIDAQTEKMDKKLNKLEELINKKKQKELDNETPSKITAPKSAGKTGKRATTSGKGR